MNPYHLTEPKHAAWERVRTLRVAPDIGDHDLRDLIDEVAYAIDEHNRPAAEQAANSAKRIEAHVEKLGKKMDDAYRAASALRDAVAEMEDIVGALENDE